MKPAVSQVLNEMRALGRAEVNDGRARFGILATAAFGLTTPQIRTIGRRLGKNQALAEELWETGVHEARILASLVGDPAAIRPATMDRWARDFQSWDVCDACSYNLFDRTPKAWFQVARFAKSEREFVRRAAFAMIAGLAMHDKAAPDQAFVDAFPLIERHAFDNRNFVRKAVNWGLRGIGKRNAGLRPAALECAARIRQQDTPSARWIAAGALRELRARGGKEVPPEC